MIIAHAHHGNTYSVDTDGRCDWTNCTHNVYDSFDAPDQTITDADIQTYRNIGLTRTQALSWVSNGLTAQQAYPWLVNGFQHAVIVARHIRAGRTLADFGLSDSLA